MEEKPKVETKQETIMDTANTKETRNRNKKEKNKTRSEERRVGKECRL